MMVHGWLAAPFLIQGAAMLVDEFWFHRRRGLGRWERVGHPLDTLTVLLCYAIALFVPYSPDRLPWYAGCAIFSMLFVTKDEFVHAKACSAEEHWLHALLFGLHPVTLAAAALIWMDLPSGAAAGRGFLAGTFALVMGFGLYQVLYWNFWKARQP
ncbi:hypothetical protein J8C06_03160 [Chloracidobacterium validum]|uniref:Uncharacterized protein n=1 Tax=Chloracidobacterium validum TaxID=2821543 RepID=A0ABX8BAK9_9BACT|nr:hypothetical protein [Chloracidobacterium validum]QUW03452.1 hypothetical protein J8C06_03160 [Chloracidobacterium validum]